jgi:predicted dehydrogenase
LVIGAGAAGARRREGNHGNALSRNPDVELTGFVDSDFGAAQAAAAAHGGQAFRDLDDGLRNEPDLVVLAIHPVARAAVWPLLWTAPTVRSILCEKPLALDLRQAADILRDSRSHGKKLYVNCQRRADETYLGLRDDVVSGRRGRLQSAAIYYTRGLWANACHWIDLALMLFGRPISVFGTPSPISSPYDGDPNVTALLGYPSFHLHLVPLRSWEQSFYTGDLDLIFDRERLFVPNTTMYETRDLKRWTVANERLRAAEPDLRIAKRENDYDGLLRFVVDDIKAGSAGESIDPMDALWTVALLHLIEKSAATGRSMPVPSTPYEIVPDA